MYYKYIEINKIAFVDSFNIFIYILYNKPYITKLWLMTVDLNFITGYCVSTNEFSYDKLNLGHLYNTYKVIEFENNNSEFL